MELGSNTLGNLVVVVRDEAEPTRMASGTVTHDDAVGDGPEAAEIVAQRLLVRLPGQAADEDLALLVRRGGRGGGVCHGGGGGGGGRRRGGGGRGRAGHGDGCGHGRRVSGQRGGKRGERGVTERQGKRSWESKKKEKDTEKKADG